MKKSLLFLFIATILISCGSLNFEKRRYNRGYYLNWSKPNHSERTQNSEKPSGPIANKINEDSNNNENHSKHPIKDDPTKEIELDTSLNSYVKSTNFQSQKDESSSFKRLNILNDNQFEKVQYTHETNFKSSNNPNQHLKGGAPGSGAWFYLILSSIPFLFLFRNRFSKISYWASNNPKKSRKLIALFSTTGALSSFAFGSISNFEVDSTMAIATMGVFGLSVMLNSIRFSKGDNFLKAKTSFLLAGISGFSGTFGLGAKYGHFALSSMQATDGEMLMHPMLAIFLTLLIIAALAASLYGLAILSCTIACNGSGFFAVAVLLGGTFLLFMLATLGIQYLFRREGQSNEKYLRNSVIVGLSVSGLILLFGLIVAIVDTL